MLEANALGETLRNQRLGELEATTLLRKVMAEIDVAVFAFDAEARLRLINRAGERLLCQPAQRLLHDPPPLGPGAPPGERLAAFYRAMVELLERHGHLALAGETGAQRYRTGAYSAWALHVRNLLAEAGLEQRDALIDILLAPLAPDVYAHQRERGIEPRAIAADLELLARRTLG